MYETFLKQSSCGKKEEWENTENMMKLAIFDNGWR